MPPSSPDQTGDPPGSVDRRDAAIAGLQRTLTDLTEQLLASQAKVLAVETELGAARARIAELEGRLHVRIVEVVELRNEIVESGAQPLVEPRVKPAMK